MGSCDINAYIYDYYYCCWDSCSGFGGFKEDVSVFQPLPSSFLLLCLLYDLKCIEQNRDECCPTVIIWRCAML